MPVAGYSFQVLKRRYCIKYFIGNEGRIPANLYKKIWQFHFPVPPLRQFFVIHLSRKAEGYGPMTPWQPKMFSQTLKGANSILTNSRER